MDTTTGTGTETITDIVNGEFGMSDTAIRALIIACLDARIMSDTELSRPADELRDDLYLDLCSRDGQGFLIDGAMAGYLLHEAVMRLAREAVEAYHDYRVFASHAAAANRGYLQLRATSPIVSEYVTIDIAMHHASLSDAWQYYVTLRHRRNDAKAAFDACIARIVELDTASANGSPMIL